MREKIVIELVEDLEGFHQCERLQKEVWGMADIAVVPDHALLTAVEAGGFLLAAFAETAAGREMVGFALSFFGRTRDGRLRHCSLMAGVKDGWRDKGVGYALKLAQREYVLRQGVELITWTFDPLESRNAHFNLNKLGCVASRYCVDYYGSLRDERNKGVPTDRFLCEWHLKSPRVERRLTQGFRGFPADLTSAIPCVIRAEGLGPGTVDLALDEGRLLVEIPPDFQALRRTSLELALRWRLATREALSHYLGRGYLATGLVRDGKRSFLLLERRSLEEVLSSTW